MKNNKRVLVRIDLPGGIYWQEGSKSYPGFGHLWTEQGMMIMRCHEGNARTMAQAMEAAAAQERQRAEPVAYMRRWAFDGIDVMAMHRAVRPMGWALHATSKQLIYPDDVPLYAAGKVVADADKEGA